MKRALCAVVIAALVLCLCNTAPAGSVVAATPAVLEKVQSDAESGITEYKLKSNGLQVLLAERHYTPIVTVMVVYHVGSRNEAVGYTGSTHFLEHMMFRGTAKHDPRKGTGIDDVLKPIGGINNATTYFDRTNYYEIVPAQYMSTCLELEADRMRNALLRESDQKSEMTVVRNELERDEDDPARLMEVNQFAQAFLAHPYHHPVIGWRTDVENVPNSRLHWFYNQFYYPNNATLVVIGDFKTADALAQIAKYFGPVPASPQPFPSVYTSEPPQQGERRFIVRRGEDLPRVSIGFHIPRATDKDTYALEVAASILGDDRKQSSRLYKALIDTSLASDCSAFNYSLRDPSMFTLNATAATTSGAATPNEKLEAALYQQAQELATKPISDDELDKAKKSVWKRLKLDAADPMGMMSQLAEAIAVADWRWWVGFEHHLKAVTKADVQRVAAKYFVKNNETVGYYYPIRKPKGDAAPEPAAGSPQSLLDVPAEAVAAASGAAAAPAAVEANASISPAPAEAVAANAGAAPAVAAPLDAGTVQLRPAPAQEKQGGAHARIADQVQKKVLPNGLTVLVMPVAGSGVVSVAGKIRAGEYFRQSNLLSVPDFVADMLDKGSAHWSKEQLAQELEKMGTNLDFSAGHFFLDFQSDVVREDLPTYLRMVSDVIQHPTFPADELDKEKKQTESEIEASKNDTGQVAANAFYSTVYKPGCVYYRKPFDQQIAELNDVSVEQLREFHRAHVTPANTVLAVVGDVDPAQAFNLIATTFGDWQGGPADKISTADCSTSGVAARTITHALPEKTNVDVIMGTPAPIDIRAADFYAASLANAALGHDTISSRLAELRNKHGLTYGIYSYFAENAYANGPWVINFSVNPGNLSKSMPIVKSILDNYRTKGITPEELKNEANRLAGEYVIERMRTPRQLADAISRYEILGLGVKFMDEYPQRLHQVTVQQADAAIKKYFDASKLVTSVAGTLSDQR
jgi:zinc protease